MQNQPCNEASCSVAYDIFFRNGDLCDKEVVLPNGLLLPLFPFWEQLLLIASGRKSRLLARLLKLKNKNINF